MKTCFKCGETKSLDEFYRHPMMEDGHLGKCKECAKADVAARYRNKKVQIREYERKRLQMPDRKAMATEYARRMRGRYPEKYAARTAAGNALRDRRLERRPCEICGREKTEAHHEDYSKPLDVRWLCKTHHLEAHGKEAL